eukprot:Phypoly_transcript_13450.p1 GENE.Phypoly_transcript_13450~~Phypoly_transcript_13450.p1  ORF type:complete len:314 (+),score=40.36 Phypoly_transcript_13450:66-1007(+)
MIPKVLLCATVWLLVNSQTTPFIQEVFIGKCYQRNAHGTANCTQLWETFSQAAQMDNWVVNASSFDPFFEIANFSSPPDRAMLWTGNQLDAMVFAPVNVDSTYIIMQNTPTGYIIDDLNWCGTTNNTFDYNRKCQYSTNFSTGYFGMEGVWDVAAREFAKGISGHLTIFLQPWTIYPNGTYLAYRNTSLLGYSLPNLTNKVTEITILLITNSSVAPYEVCTNGSLLTLTEALTAYGFKSQCIDDNQAIYNFLCPNYGSSQCLSALLAQPTTMPRKERIFLIWALVASIATAACVVLAAYFGLRVRVLESEMRI